MLHPNAIDESKGDVGSNQVPQSVGSGSGLRKHPNITLRAIGVNFTHRDNRLKPCNPSTRTNSIDEVLFGPLVRFVRARPAIARGSRS